MWDSASGLSCRSSQNFFEYLQNSKKNIESCVEFSIKSKIRQS